MGMVAIFIAVDEDSVLTKASALGLRKGRTSVKVTDTLGDALDRAIDQAAEVDIDKAWDLLHRCLNGGKLEPLRDTAEAMAIYGQADVTGMDGAVFYLSRAEVPNIAATLAKFDDGKIARIIPALADQEVYGWSGDLEEDSAYALQGLQILRDFYSDCASKGKAAVITIE